MSEFAREHDGYIAAEIISLGKTSQCRCWVDVDYIYNTRRDGAPRVRLQYKLTCPVHYPKTSALLVRTPKGGALR